MKPDLERVASAWRDQKDSYAEQFTDELLSRAGPSYTTASRDQMLLVSRQIVNAWQTALKASDDAPICLARGSFW